MSVICLFVIDPGASTGLAWGRFWEEGTIRDRVESRSHFGTDTISGYDMAQVRELWRRWHAFRQECKTAGLPCELVIEDFLLTRLKSSDREGLSPVRITAMLAGYRAGLADGYESAGFGPAEVLIPQLQQPGDAMAVTNKRLKEYGIHVPGKEHENDALRHLCLRLSKRSQRASSASRQRQD
jgi:hypothetical protein